MHDVCIIRYCMNNLFAYGTLLFEDEEPSHGINASRYIEETKTASVKGTLYAVEGFPFLVLEGDGRVKGKLFVCSEIDTLLDKYDIIEGASQAEPFFERTIVKVELSDGKKTKAYCYVAGRKLRSSFAKEEYLIRSGDWLKYYD